MRGVSVVICNYNKKEFVLTCVESVFESDFTDFDLFVVDNASTDGSVEAVRERFGDKLTVLVNEENLGGSGGFSRGMTYAMERGYRYIHLLDNDVVIDKGAIGALYEFMETHGDAGACGSLVCQLQHPDIIQDYGAGIVPEMLGVKPFFCNESRNQPLPDMIECDYVAACSAMYRVEALEKSGAIDKEFFIYWDDMALSWELRLSGFKIYAAQKSVVWHNHGLINLKTTFGIYYFFRNKVRVFTKYLGNKEYEDFVNNLVTRLFRVSAVNRNTGGKAFTYLHAIDDAINDVRGKANDYKILVSDEYPDKFKRLLRGSRRIVLVPYDGFPHTTLQRVVNGFRELTGGDICVKSTVEGYGEVNGAVMLGDSAMNNDGDLLIELCPHILDLKRIERGKVYMDYYFNVIMDDEDRGFIENLEIHQKFFIDVFYGFIKSKLDALRANIRPKEWD